MRSQFRSFVIYLRNDAVEFTVFQKSEKYLSILADNITYVKICQISSRNSSIASQYYFILNFTSLTVFVFNYKIISFSELLPFNRFIVDLFFLILFLILYTSKEKRGGGGALRIQKYF